MSLLPFDALYELASLFTESTKKYPARNWERGLSWSETQDSLLRHMTAWSNKDDVDSESGFNHDVHILWNAIVLVTMRLRGIGKDDRSSPLDKVLDAVGDGSTHTPKGDISDPVVPVTASDDPVAGTTTNDITNVVRPYDYRTDPRIGWTAEGTPLTSDIK